MTTVTKNRRVGSDDQERVFDDANSLATPVYASVPKWLCERPPIKHRRCDDELLATVRELAVGLALITIAHLMLGSRRHARAYAAGEKRIQRQNQHREEFAAGVAERVQAGRKGQKLPAPQLQHAYPHKGI